MDILNCQEAFGAQDKTTKAMQKAVQEWFDLYYRDTEEKGEDPCQRIAFTVVSKVVRTAFAEYQNRSADPVVRQLMNQLDKQKEQAVQLALVGGECYIKPWVMGAGFGFTLIPRNALLVFGRDPAGLPTDVGTLETSTLGSAYYHLLERRTLDENGYLTIENKLYRAYDAGSLGSPVSLKQNPLYADLPERYTYPEPMGSVGLVQLKTPMLNCVDGSKDGVSLYAAAAALIHSIDRNEYQLKQEFERGESRVFASRDLLRDGALSDHLFVGLDEDPEHVGMTVYSPQLREQAFLNRKQEYLRNVESVVGLKRGLLSDANVEERTATEIASSQGEHALTVMDFQRMWQTAAEQTVILCATLAKLYGVAAPKDTSVAIDWGNGVLHDEEKLWQDYLVMVDKGLIAPEIALGWRFNLPTETEEERKAIREKFMPTMNN